ncbi:Uncharacterised protein [Klebsiella pneumoniae]|uniref:Uncharacterized protein n=1 Tax=Klebsiella pneumoniae TaxID=573 RepID=A0A2X3F8J2_KLEPN|nr:Uncharacterised protein [Klebsiella pneumoniae]
MELINRAWNWAAYLWSVFLGSVGMMTQKDWLDGYCGSNRGSGGGVR